METLAGFDGVSIDRVQFVDLYPENFKCDQCGLLVKLIVKTPAPFKLTENGYEDSSLNPPSRPRCGHKFCLPCYNSLSSDGRLLKCPIDSLIVPKKEFTEDRLDSETILDKDVYCSYRSRGCKRTCRLRDLKDHMKTCVYGIINCPLKCGEGIVIKKLASHMAMECPRRTINCSFCEEDVPFQSRKDHESNCPRRPTICTYCKRKMAFGDLRKHFEICPGKPRTCKLTPMGCKFVGTKEEIEQHESIWKIHVDPLVKYVLNRNDNYSDDLKLRVNDILTIIKELNEENTTLKRSLEKLSFQLQTIIGDNSILKDQINKMESKFQKAIDSMTDEQKFLIDELQRVKDVVIIGESSV